MLSQEEPTNVLPVPLEYRLEVTPKDGFLVVGTEVVKPAWHWMNADWPKKGIFAPSGVANITGLSIHATTGNELERLEKGDSILYQGTNFSFTGVSDPGHPKESEDFRSIIKFKNNNTILQLCLVDYIQDGNIASYVFIFSYHGLSHMTTGGVNFSSMRNLHSKEITIKKGKKGGKKKSRKNRRNKKSRKNNRKSRRG